MLWSLAGLREVLGILKTNGKQKPESRGGGGRSLILLWVAWLAFLLYIVFMQGETRQALVESPLIFHIIVTIFNHPRTSMLKYAFLLFTKFGV